VTPEKAAQKGSGSNEQFAGFGPNEWLVYEMYQQYLKDPESVDKAWWDFFADYQPADAQGSPPANGAPTATSTTTETKERQAAATTARQAAAGTAAPVSQKAAPAATGIDAFSAVTPPTATDGNPAAAASRANSSGPIAFPASPLEAVVKNGPMPA